MAKSPPSLVFSITLLCFASLHALTAVAQSCARLAYSVEFQPPNVEPQSFFHTVGQPATITTGRVFPRIIVRILDSAGKVDRVTRGLKVEVSYNAPNGLSAGIIGDGKLDKVFVVSGEAHFTDLTVQSGSGFTLSFRVLAVTAGLNATVIGQQVTTGVITALLREEPLFKIDFARNQSAIRFANSTSSSGVTVISGETLPLIRVLVLTSSYLIFDESVSQVGTVNVNNLTVRADMPGVAIGSVTLSGNEVPVLLGQAVFNRLVITTSIPDAFLPPLVFRLNAIPDRPLQTAPLPLASSLQRFDNIDFDPEETSFIFTRGQQLSAVNDIPLPSFSISVRDTVYRNTLPKENRLIITASCPKLVGVSASLTGHVVGMINGVATFTSLTFLRVFHEELQPYVLTFTAGNQGNLPVAGKQIFTGIVMVSRAPVPAYSFRFYTSPLDSFFIARDRTAIVSTQKPITPAIQLELLNSANQRDNDTASVVVGLRTVGVGLDLTVGNVQLKPAFDRGLARFDLLQPIDQGNTLFIFSASSTKGNPVHNKYLVTGLMNVTKKDFPMFNLRFQPYGGSSISQNGQPSFATLGTALPPILVEIVTSAGAVDTAATGVGVTATSTNGAILSGNFIRTTNGLAIFSDLQFLSVSGSFIVTFTVTSAPTGAIAQGKSIATGPIDVAVALTANYRPIFHNESYIAFEGHSMPFTDNIPMPPIYVFLADSSRSRIPPIAELLSGSGSVNRTDSSTLSAYIRVTPSGDTFRPQKVQFVNGLAVIPDLTIVGATNPVITVCVTLVQEACISSGSMLSSTSPAPVGGLRIVNQTLTGGRPLSVSAPRMPLYVFKSQPVPIAVALLDSGGAIATSYPNTYQIEARSNVPIGGTSQVPLVGGIAYFSNLLFTADMPQGISPAITFTVRDTAATGAAAATSVLSRVLPISTGLVYLRGQRQTTGVDVVSEVLFDYRTFDFDTWRDNIARRLNVEKGRIVKLRVFSGTSADPDPNGVTEETTSKPPSWKGTRVEFRFLPALPTSRNTKDPAELANLFVNLLPSCQLGDLFLRKSYLKADDLSCDWYIFDDQMQAVRACIQAKGKSGYCTCHVPLFTAMGLKCLGLPRMTSLCLDVLINSQSADCPDAPIRDVCRLLRFPDVPRTELAASGAFLALFFPVLLYVYYKGILHKLSRPTGGRESLTVHDEGLGVDKEMML